jgi:hypothetical protein
VGIGNRSGIPHLTPTLSAPLGPLGGGEGEGVRTGGGEFSSLAEAQAWLAAVPQAIGTLSQTQLAGTVLRIEGAYDQFPELLARFPRRALLRHVRAAAALSDSEAVPLLLLCAAAEPSDSASLAGLFERAARAHGSAALLSLVRLFRRHVDLGWEAIGPAVAALGADEAGTAAILAILSEILGGAGDPPEGAAELGRVLAPLLVAEPEAEPSAAIDPAILAHAAAGARRHLAEAPAEDGEAARRHDWLALAARLQARLRPPERPPGAARPAWPSGEIGFPSFLAQWPELAIEVPAGQLDARYAVLGADGVLRAARHEAGAFCSGPYLNLPAGRYRVRIAGEAAAGAEYSVQAACRLGERAAAPLCERRYAPDGPIVGPLAELDFTSDVALRDFQVVVSVASPSAALAIASLTITADRLRPDPEA